MKAHFCSFSKIKGLIRTAEGEKKGLWSLIRLAWKCVIPTEKKVAMFKTNIGLNRCECERGHETVNRPAGTAQPY